MQELQLLPVKLVPGFIGLDFVVGCAACNFCVARRNPLVNEAFETKSFRSLISNVDQFIEKLSALPSFSTARIPLRIGNDSDFAFQRSPVRELLLGIAHDYPAVVLTRFPLERADVKLLSARSKATLLKITLTPKSKYVDGFSNPSQMLESLREFQGNLLVTIGPLVQDNFEGAKEIINNLPQHNSLSVYLKPLDKEALPLVADVPEMAADQIRELEYLIDERGFRLNSFMLCLLFGNLHREDPRSVDIPKNEIRHCFSCDSRDLCWQDSRIADPVFANVCLEVGLRAESVQKVGFRSYRIAVDAPSAYGDEAYLSYRVGRKVRLTRTAEGTLRHSALASPSVIGRWERVGFFSPEAFSDLAPRSGARKL